MPKLVEREQEINLTNIPPKSTENPPPDPPRRPTANFGGDFESDWILEAMRIAENRFAIHQQLDRGAVFEQKNNWETNAATFGEIPTVRLRNKIVDHETSSLN